MNLFLSINSRFFKIKPEELIELIIKYDENNLIKGFEIGTNSQEDENYILKLATIATSNNYLINLHSPTLKTTQEYKNYIDFAVKLSKITNRKINIVFHSINTENIEESKRITTEYLMEIYDYISKNKYKESIEISIENLNKKNNINRLEKEQLIPILETEKDLKFTYDIGHEIVDGKEIGITDKILKDRINNIHVHTHNKNIDHYPITECENKENKIIKDEVLNIVQIKPDINIVMEYAIDYIDENDFYKKLKKYIQYAHIFIA